jgi:hypothetical protein
MSVIAIKAMTRVLTTTVAWFAILHPRVVLLALLALAAGLIGLAAVGAYSLLMQPSLPKLLFGAAVAVAAWLWLPPD